ncbi:hypothetical protein Tco_0668506 [Tanacetum coccineum]
MLYTFRKGGRIEHSDDASLSIHSDECKSLPESTSNSSVVEQAAWVKSNTICVRRSNNFELETLSQGDSLNHPDHRYRMTVLQPHSSKFNSLPHAHAQTTKTYYNIKIQNQEA